MMRQLSEALVREKLVTMMENSNARRHLEVGRDTRVGEEGVAVLYSLLKQKLGEAWHDLMAAPLMSHRPASMSAAY